MVLFQPQLRVFFSPDWFFPTLVLVFGWTGHQPFFFCPSLVLRVFFFGFFWACLSSFFFSFPKMGVLGRISQPSGNSHPPQRGGVGGPLFSQFLTPPVCFYCFSGKIFSFCLVWLLWADLFGFFLFGFFVWLPIKVSLPPVERSSPHISNFFFSCLFPPPVGGKPLGFRVSLVLFAEQIWTSFFKIPIFPFFVLFFFDAFTKECLPPFSFSQIPAMWGLPPPNQRPGGFLSHNLGGQKPFFFHPPNLKGKGGDRPPRHDMDKKKKRTKRKKKT